MLRNRKAPIPYYCLFMYKIPNYLCLLHLKQLMCLFQLITPFKIVKIHMIKSIYASAFLEFVFHVICNYNGMHLFWTFSLVRFATVIMIIMLIKVSCEFLCNKNIMNLCNKFPNLTALIKNMILTFCSQKMWEQTKLKVKFDIFTIVEYLDLYVSRIMNNTASVKSLKWKYEEL